MDVNSTKADMEASALLAAELDAASDDDVPLHDEGTRSPQKPAMAPEIALVSKRNSFDLMLMELSDGEDQEGTLRDDSDHSDGSLRRPITPDSVSVEHQAAGEEAQENHDVLPRKGKAATKPHNITEKGSAAASAKFRSLEDTWQTTRNRNSIRKTAALAASVVAVVEPSGTPALIPSAPQRNNGEAVGVHTCAAEKPGDDNTSSEQAAEGNTRRKTALAVSTVAVVEPGGQPTPFNVAAPQQQNVAVVTPTQDAVEKDRRGNDNLRQEKHGLSRGRSKSPRGRSPSPKRSVSPLPRAKSPRPSRSIHRRDTTASREPSPIVLANHHRLPKRAITARDTSPTDHRHHHLPKRANTAVNHATAQETIPRKHSPSRGISEGHDVVTQHMHGLSSRQRSQSPRHHHHHVPSRTTTNHAERKAAYEAKFQYRSGPRPRGRSPAGRARSKSHSRETSCDSPTQHRHHVPSRTTTDNASRKAAYEAKFHDGQLTSYLSEIAATDAAIDEAVGDTTPERVQTPASHTPPPSTSRRAIIDHAALWVSFEAKFQDGPEAGGPHAIIPATNAAVEDSVPVTSNASTAPTEEGSNSPVLGTSTALTEERSNSPDNFAHHHPHHPQHNVPSRTTADNEAWWAAYEAKSRPNEPGRDASPATNKRADLDARRAASEQKFHTILAGLTGSQSDDLDLMMEEEGLQSQDGNEGKTSHKDGSYNFLDIETPGAYNEDKEGNVLNRNQSARYSRLGEEARDEEAQQEEPDIVVSAMETNRNANDQEEPPLVNTPPSTGGLVEALPVRGSNLPLDLDVERIGDEELDKMTVQEDRNVRKAWRWAIKILCCVLVIAVAIALVVYFLVRKDDGAEPAPPMPPTLAPTPFYFDVPDYTAEAIMKSADTPQSQAYRWLRDDPNWQSYPEWRLGQRFALATLYFATTAKDIASVGTGDRQDWAKSTHWLSYEHHECEWYFSRHFQEIITTVTADSPCGDDGETLERLWLRENNLHGSIPPELYWLTSLKSIDLRLNHLEGSLSSHVGRLARLEQLDLDRNKLTSTIPTEVGALANLEGLELWFNSLSGPLPTQLGSLSKLTDLYLSSNQLTGPIPSQLENLQRLEFLLLDENNLTKSIPPQLSKISSLRYIVLHDNHLTGIIPTELRSAPSLYSFFASGNKLTGTIPTELCRIDSLGEISFQRNLLTGTVPTCIGLLASLNGLFLGQNQLSGVIPSEIGRALFLEDLDLSNNRFTGSLPSELFATDMRWMAAHHNNLTGTIPTEIGQVNKLSSLALNENLLSGSMPSEIGLMGGLKLLNLTSNRLSGSLPAEIGSLSAIIVLHLEFNKFVGPIPTEINLLRNLTSFRWSSFHPG